MKTTRKPTKAEEPPPISRDEAIAALKEYTLAHIKCEHIVVRAKAAVERLKAHTEKQLKPWLEIKLDMEDTLHRYADEHPELFEKSRKIELYGGHKLGYHTNPPKVAYVRLPGEKKKQNEEGFIARCKALGGSLIDFIRSVTTEEPNKDAIIRQHAELSAAAEAALKATPEAAPMDVEEYAALLKFQADLRTAGATVIQEEDFVIVLNLQPEGEKQ
jgi:hypothetical protein